MSEIPQLESRIAAALERIRAGLDAVPGPDVVQAAQQAEALSGQVETLQAALEAERSAKAALEADGTGRDALEAEVADLRARLEAAEAEKTEMMDAMQKLQSVNADLRLAAAEGVTDPETINAALAADLEALQMARAADLRDINAILSELAPMAQEA